LQIEAGSRKKPDADEDKENLEDPMAYLHDKVEDQFEDMSSHAGSEQYEQVLRGDLAELEENARFGTYSSDKFRTKDVKHWDLYHESAREDPPWWQGIPDDHPIMRFQDEFYWKSRATVSAAFAAHASAVQQSSARGLSARQSSAGGISARLSSAGGSSVRHSVRRATHISRQGERKGRADMVGIEVGYIESSSSEEEDDMLTPRSRQTIITARNSLSAREAEAKISAQEVMVFENLERKPSEDWTVAEAAFMDREIKKREAGKKAAEVSAKRLRMKREKDSEVRTGNRNALDKAEFIKLQPWVGDLPDEEVQEEMDRYEIRYHGRKRVFVEKATENPMAFAPECCQCHQAEHHVRHVCHQAYDSLNQSLPTGMLPFTPPVPPSTPRQGQDGLPNIATGDDADSMGGGSRCIVL
jgi:hypothetical protein